VEWAFQKEDLDEPKEVTAKTADGQNGVPRVSVKLNCKKENLSEAEIQRRRRG
jgi:hypothetical protein